MMILKDYDYVFYLGHFKSYCNYLELDSKELVEQFKYKISFNKNEIPDKIPKPKFKKIIYNSKTLFIHFDN